MTDLVEVCKTYGAIVAEIREEKADKAIQEIGKYHFHQGVSQFIIGSGNDETEEGKWVWASDGQLFTEMTSDKIIDIYNKTDWRWASDGSQNVNVGTIFELGMEEMGI